MGDLRFARHKFSSGDGELGASLRYLSQRISTPYNIVKGILTDVGTGVAEMFHVPEIADNDTCKDNPIPIHTGVSEMFQNDKTQDNPDSLQLL